MNSNIEKDTVIIDRVAYDDLIFKINNDNKKIEELEKRCNIFEKVLLDKIYEADGYEINRIEEVNLEDYYVRKIISDFYEYGNFEMDYMFEKIKDFIKKYKQEKEEENKND